MGVREYGGENQNIAAALGGRFLSAAKRHQVRGSTADIAFKGVQCAVDSRPEPRGIEVPPVAGSRISEGHLSLPHLPGLLISAVQSMPDARLD